MTGRSAARRVTEFEVEDLPCKVAHIIPRGDGSDGTFSPEAFLEPKELRKIGDFILYGIAAADEALADSGWKPETEADRIATGVMIGSGIGGIEGIAENAIILKERGPAPHQPVLHSRQHHQPGVRPGVDPPQAQGAEPRRRHRLLDRRACDRRCGAADHLRRRRRHGGRRRGIADRPAIAGRLRRLPGAVDRPQRRRRETASRPYDRDRDGFVMGEGAGVVVLEELEHAKARGAKIYAEVTGYGLSGDAYHITAPAEDGDGAYRCMAMALKRAGLAPSDIDYINAHGTSTMADTIELAAVERLVGNAASKISMSSTKSSIGHLLGAAGAAEAIFSILAIRDNIAPADHQSRQSGARDGDRPRAAYSRARARSMSRCPTRSVSAAPTPRSFSSATMVDAILR